MGGVSIIATLVFILCHRAKRKILLRNSPLVFTTGQPWSLALSLMHQFVVANASPLGLFCNQ